MKLRRLTPAGIEKFRIFLSVARAGAVAEPPMDALHHSDLSADMSQPVEVDLGMRFKRRLDAGEYFYRLLDELGAEQQRDVGMWAWLTLAFIDQAIPPGPTGTRKVGEDARYIPAPNAYQRFYRHLLMGPWMTFRAHAADPLCALAVLAAPLSTPGDLVEQLASRQELVTNRALMAVATTLYVDGSTGGVKRGAGGKAAGSARRLVDVANQLDLNYDLYSMSVDELLGRLPREFDRFRPAGLTGDSSRG